MATSYAKALSRTDTRIVRSHDNTSRGGVGNHRVARESWGALDCVEEHLGRTFARLLDKRDFEVREEVILKVVREPRTSTDIVLRTESSTRLR